LKNANFHALAVIIANTKVTLSEFWNAVKFLDNWSNGATRRQKKSDNMFIHSVTILTITNKQTRFNSTVCTMHIASCSKNQNTRHI